MSVSWPSTSLGEILTPAMRERKVGPTNEYPLLGVRLDGLGPFHRETVIGAETSASYLYEVRAGDFIYSRLFAWRGAFGIIGDDFDGYFVSNEFPAFTAIEGRVDPRFLRYWFRLRDVLRRVEADCSGSTPLTRNRFKEEYFLALEVPLPPLHEQRRIVARIEELAAKVEEALALRSNLIGETDTLWLRHAAQLFSSMMPTTPPTLDEVAYIVGGQSLPDLTGESAMIGDVHLVKVSDMNRPGNEVYLHTSAISVSDSSSALRSVRLCPPGTIIFPKRGGAIATNKKRMTTKPSVLDPNIMGIYPRPDSNLSTDYLFAWIRTIDLAAMQDGTSVPQINKGDLAPILFPLVAMEMQQRIVAELDALQEKVDAVKALQAETAAELDAMLPAILDRAFKGQL